MNADNQFDELFARLETVAVRLRDSGVKAALLDAPSSRPLETTNDIDLVVSSIKEAIRAFSDFGFFIQLRPQKKKSLESLPLPHFRACYGIGGKVLTVDLVQVKDEPRSPWAGLYSTIEKHPLIGFPVGCLSVRVAWKTYRYFAVGKVVYAKQLSRLQDQWLRLCESDTRAAIELVRSFPEGSNALILRERLIRSQNDEALAELLEEAKNTNGYRTKEQNRLVLGGSLLVGRITAALQVSRAFFYRFVLRYPISAFPVIAFVGNDGGGKSSTITGLASDRLVKLDPLVLSLKRKDSFLRLFRPMRRWLSNITAQNDRKTISWALVFPARWLLEAMDFVDRLLRFWLSLLWARSGLGPVFMDRYVTDRLRGEYARDKFQLYPLEQFFPMPDAFTFFDVPAEISMERKPEDNHNLTVLREKRSNYIKLMNEINRVHRIDGASTPSNVSQSTSAFILSVCHEIAKSQRGGSARKWGRATWRPGSE